MNIPRVLDGVRLIVSLTLVTFLALGCAKSASNGDAHETNSILNVNARLTGLTPGKSVTLRLMQGDALVNETQREKDGEFFLGQVDARFPYDVTLTDKTTDPNCTTGQDQADDHTTNIRFLVQCHSIALFAGNMGGPGNYDGQNGAVRFYGAAGIAVDGGGNIYVVDSGNKTIRKITAEGIVTTLAGAVGQIGSADGVGDAARFGTPNGLAMDPAGNAYVTDLRNYTIRKIDAEGLVTTFAGKTGEAGIVDGLGDAARFESATSIASDAKGNLYVTESLNHLVRKIDTLGTVTTFAGAMGQYGSEDGTGGAARFRNPRAIATDANGNVYVADSGNSIIRKITPTGDVTTLAGTALKVGNVDGVGSDARFYEPNTIAVDANGIVYVSDSNNVIRKIDPQMVVTTLAGSPGTSGNVDGVGSAAHFTHLNGIATDAIGNVYVAEYDAIRKISPEGVVTTIAGEAAQSGNVDGVGAAARFNYPQGVATDASGNVYVADTRNDVLRKITPLGVVSTLVNSTPKLRYPVGIVTDLAGNLFVADTGNHMIQKFATNGLVSRLAGSNNGLIFDHPYGVAIDTNGIVYVTDTNNHAIQKIANGGGVTGLAGMSKQSGSADGLDRAAQFNLPEGIAVDTQGDIFVADTGNHIIRKINQYRMVTTIAGVAGKSGNVDGKGGDARFYNPRGIATDTNGNVYVADTYNNSIRKITADGTVSTVVGKPGSFGFTPGALPGVLYGPTAIAITGSTMYITLYNGVAVVYGLP